MPNIGAALKSEISRIARKEVIAEVATLRRSSTVHRKEIASLRVRLQELEKVERRLRSGQAKMPPLISEKPAEGQRFSHRKRLGLSAAEVGLLLGTSAQSVYNWEQGKARPRAGHLPAITALRTLGKKTAKEVIATRRAPSREKT